MASLQGQKGLLWGRAEAVWRGVGKAPHEDIVLNITKYLKRHIVLSTPQLVKFLVRKHRFLTRRFIFRENPALCWQEALRKSNEKHSSHAEPLDMNQHRLTKLLFTISLCFFDDCKRLDLPGSFCCGVTVAGSIFAGHCPAGEPLCPALRPLQLVELHAEERLFGDCDREN